MADEENVVGSASVKVTTDLTEFNAGMAQAEAKTKAFDQTANAAMARTAQSTSKLTAAQESYVKAIVSGNLTLEQTAKFLGKSADGQQALATIMREVEARTKGATIAAKELTAAQQAWAAASGGAPGGSEAATRIANDRATTEQLRVRMAITRQRAAEQMAEETATFALRMRLTKQQANEAEQEANRVAKAEQAASASTLAFRQRMNRQRFAEEAAGARVEAQREAGYSAAMAAQAGENFRRETNQLRGLTESGAVPAASKSAKDSAAVFSTLALTPEMKAAEASVKRIEEGVVKVGGATKGTAGIVREFAVILREAGRGDFSRLAGSATILGDRLGVLEFLLTPVGVGIAAVTAALLAAAAAALAWANSEEHLTNVLAGVGRQSGLTRDQVVAATKAAADASGQSEYATRAAAEAFAAAGVRSQEALTALSGDVEVFARLTGQKGPAALKELAGAMEDPVKGAKQLNEQMNLFDETQLRAIKSAQDAGDQARAQAIVMGQLEQATKGANAAGIATATIWDRAASALKEAAAQAGAAALEVGKLAALGPIGYVNNAKNERGQAAKAAAYQRQAAQEAAANRASALAGSYASETPEGREQANFDELKAKRDALKAGMDVEARRGNSDQLARDKAAYEALRDTVARLSDAHGNLIRSLDREHQAADLVRQEVAARKAHNTELVKELETRKRLLDVGDKVISGADLQRQAADQGAIAGARATKAGGRKDTFARQDGSKEADAAGELALANAYGVSDAAAIRAEASRKALTEATRAGRTAAQEALLVQAELNLEVAKGAADGAKKAAGLDAEAKAQNAANAALAKGDIGKKEAARSIQESVEIAHLEALADAGSAKQKEALLAVIERLKDAYDRLNDSKSDAEAASLIDKDTGEIAKTKLKASLIGSTQRDREIAIARDQTTRDLGGADEVGKSDLKKQAVDVAAQLAGVKVDEEQAQAYAKVTQTVEKEIEALKKASATLGLTRQAAATYEEMQKLVAEATKDGTKLTEDQRAQLQGLANAYGSASAAAYKFQQAQKGAADASKALAGDVEQGIEAMIYDGAKLNTVVRGISQSIGKNVLKATLTGEGPFAGLLGTSQSSREGGPNGGLLSGIFGAALGVGTKKPTGAAGDPLHVIMDSAAKLAGGLGGGITSALGLGGGGGAAGGAVDMMAGLFHDGTSYVGTPQRQVAVSPSLFVGAPRLHSGLAPDEFPAILQRGERVTDRRGGSPGGNRQVHVHIASPDVGGFQRSAGQVARETKRAMRSNFP